MHKNYFRFDINCIQCAIVLSIKFIVVNSRLPSNSTTLLGSHCLAIDSVCYWESAKKLFQQTKKLHEFDYCLNCLLLDVGSRFSFFFLMKTHNSPPMGMSKHKLYTHKKNIHKKMLYEKIGLMIMIQQFMLVHNSGPRRN